MKVKTILVLALVVPYIFVGLLSSVSAIELDSSNYKIIDPNTDSGGGVSESGSYGLLSSTGTIGDRITSTSYQLDAGFPAGIQANVPAIICAETDTNTSTTNCVDFPNADGAVGECGTPGCYTSAKIEVDPSGNPVDALYLVRIEDTTNSVSYYLQSDHSIATSYDINDYLDLCALQGIDVRSESNCTNSSEGDWDEALQSQNIFGLIPETDYSVSVRALNGDFTEGVESSQESFRTTAISISFDLDIGANSSANTQPPHTINFGVLSSASALVATDQIWIDVSGNARNGFSVYVRDEFGGLSNGTDTIPSSSEDLDVDPGADGGFGIRVDSVSETSLGPLTAAAAYDVVANNVGAVSTSDALILSTTLGGSNFGAITAGRAGIELIARSSSVDQGGIYSDTLTFTLIPSL